MGFLLDVSQRYTNMSKKRSCECIALTLGTYFNKIITFYTFSFLSFRKGKERKGKERKGKEGKERKGREGNWSMRLYICNIAWSLQCEGDG